MAQKIIQKVLIANRGEIAIRVMRTCKEMGITTVAVYSDADRKMPHVLAADEAYHIGPAPARESYLSIERLLDAAIRSKADAIHPGYGFLSENEDFAQAVQDAGLIFIGPRPESIRAMGDKTEARKLMRAAGVPIVPGTDVLDSVTEAQTFCEKYGFPVLIKAAAGGGGKGMRVVETMSDLASLFRAAQSESTSAFGDHRVYLEKYLEEPRHVEFQILADQHGNVVHLGERECSIQRRHQKVIEETPSVIVDEAIRNRMGATAVMAAKACAYHNAGTIEFLVDKSRSFYFLEMNTRLQVEHPITEMRTRIDIVAQQLQIAAGGKLRFAQEDIRFRGHAIECRIYAEDGSNDFAPSTGSITHLKASQGSGIREDRGIEQGGEVSVYYDPLLAKLVAWGNTRTEAIDRMKRALREYEILGVKTNIDVNLFVLEHPKFVDGDFDTHFFSRYFNPADMKKPSEAGTRTVAVVCALLHHQSLSNPVSTTGGGRHSLYQKAISFNHRAGGKWKDQRLQR